MLENRLFTAFPIYTSLSEQNRFKIGYSSEINDVTTQVLVTDKSRILPFQFRKPADTLLLTSIKAVNVHTGVETEISGRLIAGQVDYETAEGYDYIIHYGTADMTSDLDCAAYYLKMTDGSQIWYSEVFVTEDIIPTPLEETPDYAMIMNGVYLISASGTYITWR